MSKFIELTNSNRDKVYVNTANLVAFHRAAGMAHTALCLVGQNTEIVQRIEHVVETPEQILKKIREEGKP